VGQKIGVEFFDPLFFCDTQQRSQRVPAPALDCSDALRPENAIGNAEQFEVLIACFLSLRGLLELMLHFAVPPADALGGKSMV
jgi:hypothetical protein